MVLFFCAAAAWAQFKSTVPLVVAPTTVKDAKGRYVDGLEPRELVLYDNNVPQQIQIDYSAFPISLVVAVQNTESSEAVLGKLAGSGILFSQLMAGDAGETALLSFNRRIRLRQDFTSDPDRLAAALRGLRPEGGGASTLDAVMQSLHMLGERKPDRRRIVLVIAEKRDRSSETRLPDVVGELQRENAAIYWLSWSPFKTPFTDRHVKTVGEEKGIKKSDDPKDDEPAVPDDQPMNLLVPLFELAHLSAPNISDLLPKATGGRTINFLTRGALEAAIQAMGEEIHRQYILTFQPRPGEPGEFHALRAEVKGRPELQVKTRAGYWTAQ